MLPQLEKLMFLSLLKENPRVWMVEETIVPTATPQSKMQVFQIRFNGGYELNVTFGQRQVFVDVWSVNKLYIPLSTFGEEFETGDPFTFNDLVHLIERISERSNLKN